MNDRYGWDDREDRARYRRHSAEGSYRPSSNPGSSRNQDNSADRWRSEGDDWISHGTAESNRYQGRSDFDRERRFGGAGTFGYGEGRSAHDERVGGYGGGSYGSGGGSGGQNGSYGAQQSLASQSDRGRRYSSSDYGYGAGQQGDSSSQQPYFTGQQQAWQVPSSYGAGDSFGAGSAPGYGADYREHGYGSRQHERGFLQRAGDEVASWFGDEDAARRREADHRGRGPADYTRSDERIREDVNDCLTEDWRVDASGISVAVKDGEITLSGAVNRREDKRRAEDIVEDLSGVKHVQNNLRVEQQAGWSGTSTSAGTRAGSATSFGSSSTGAATTAGKAKLEPPQT